MGPSNFDYFFQNKTLFAPYVFARCWWWFLNGVSKWQSQISFLGPLNFFFSITLFFFNLIFTPYIIYIQIWALSQKRTCRPPLPLQKWPPLFWLYMVRNVLNRTRMWIQKISDFFFSSYHRKLGWFFRKMTLKWP